MTRKTISQKDKQKDKKILLKVKENRLYADALIKAKINKAKIDQEEIWKILTGRLRTLIKITSRPLATIEEKKRLMQLHSLQHSWKIVQSVSSPPEKIEANIKQMEKDIDEGKNAFDRLLDIKFNTILPDRDRKTLQEMRSRFEHNMGPILNALQTQKRSKRKQIEVGLKVIGIDERLHTEELRHGAIFHELYEEIGIFQEAASDIVVGHVTGKKFTQKDTYKLIAELMNITESDKQKKPYTWIYVKDCLTYFKKVKKGTEQNGE